MNLLDRIVSTVLLALVNSCNFAQSVNKDLVTGLVTRGNGLTCDEVYLASDREVLKRNAFVYGEAFIVNFDGIEGFNRTDENAFPGMQLVVVSQQGDPLPAGTQFHSDRVSNQQSGYL